MSDHLILLTNDDGIESPGLWAAAESLSEIAEVYVVAPAGQYTGAGRSMPPTTRGTIKATRVSFGGREREAYAVDGSPAQAARSGILEVLPRKPDIVVSGINYGENVGTSVTISGTVGAAIEAATLGVPAVAVSLQVDPKHNYAHTEEVDFTPAAHFTRVGVFMMRRAAAFFDVDVLKIDVPAGATEETPWRITRQSRHYYYEPVKPDRVSFEDPVPFRYRIQFDRDALERDGDIYALQVEQVVAMTPLSIDLTSRVDLAELERAVKEDMSSLVE